MENEPRPLEIIRAALHALNASQPDIVAKLSAALRSCRKGESELRHVEAAFREAAVALVPTDKDAAETLFTLAEVFAQIPRFN